MDSFTTNEPNDGEIRGLALARSGDPHALQELISDHLTLMHAQARRHGAEVRSLRESDIVQSAVLRVLQSLPDFRGTSKQAFVTWLGTIVKNTVRKKQRFWGSLKRAGEMALGEGDEHLATQDSPSVEVSQIEALVNVAQAMQQLSEPQRRALELKLFEGLPYPTIAEELKTTIPAARMLVSRARAALAIEIARIEERR